MSMSFKSYERGLYSDGIESMSIIEEINSLKQNADTMKKENTDLKDLKQDIQILWDYLNAMNNFNKNSKTDSKDYKIPLDLYKEIYLNAKLDLENQKQSDL